MTNTVPENEPAAVTRTDLGGFAALGVAGVGLAAAYTLSDGRIGLPCPLFATTGLQCPLCGSTRMAAALLQGDVAAAWSFNAPVLVLSVLFALSVGYRLLTRTRVRRGAARVPAVPRRLVAQVVIAGLVAFGIARNLW